MSAHRRLHGHFAAALILSLALQISQSAHSQVQNITFTKVVDTDTPVPPENTETFFGFFPPSLDAGNVAFIGSNDSLVQAVYRWADGELTEIADPRTPLPDGPPNFIRRFGQLPSIDGESVTFVAFGQLGTAGIYKGDGGPLETIVDTNSDAPPPMNDPLREGGKFFGFQGFPTTDDGMTVFTASSGVSELNIGVYLIDLQGMIEVVADRTTPNPSSSTTFDGFDSALTDQGNVAFVGSSGPPDNIEGLGVFKWVDGELRLVADRDTLIPGKTFTFDGFGVSGNLRVDIGGREVAFLGTRIQPRFFGVVGEIDDQLQVLAEEGMPTPDGQSILLDFNIVSIDQGNVAFSTEVRPVRGIFLKRANGGFIKIIDNTDHLDGKAIDFFRFGLEGLSGNEVAFGVDFVDGSRAIFIARFGGLPPLADAGLDQTAECTSPNGALVTLDGSGSSDPDGDPLTYTWTDGFGVVEGVKPEVLLALGSHLVTLVVNDGQSDSDTDTVTITVEDKVAPGLAAGLTPIGTDDDDDEGRFRIDFSAADVCDPSPVVTAVLVVPGSPDIPVVDGQVIEFELEDDETEIELEEGRLEIEAPGLTLAVTATDASGNSATAEVSPAFPVGEEDEDEVSALEDG